MSENIKNGVLHALKETVGVTAKDNRLFVNSILYRYRAGIPWRDFRVVHTRHTRWNRSGVWKEVFEELANDADNEYATIVRAHQHSAGAKKKSLKTTKPSDEAQRFTPHAIL